MECPKEGLCRVIAAQSVKMTGTVGAAAAGVAENLPTPRTFSSVLCAWLGVVSIVVHAERDVQPASIR